MRLINTRDKVNGKVMLDDESMMEMPIYQFRYFRGKNIDLVSQAAMGGLNSVFNIVLQIMEAIKVHKKCTNAEAMELTKRLLERFRIDPSRVKAFPHELNGGMRQRVMIALTLSCDLEVVITDEMITALDIITRVQMLKLFNELRETIGISVIAISHVLPILGQICDKIMVMYASQMSEMGEIFREPVHLYTKWFLNSFVDISEPRRILRSIPGKLPSLFKPHLGYRYVRQKCLLW